MDLTQAPELFVYREQRESRALRRVFDVAIVLAMLPAVLPVLALASVAVYAEDGWPVLFRQRRVGRYERLFTMFKLRTMYRDQCGDRRKPVDGRDPRITRVGAFLRKLSIDEFPQLFNVLRGDMTLVGPRPEMPFLVRRYDAWQHMRHFVTPGLTCIWQTECRSTVALERPEATNLDLRYIATKSPLGDAQLLTKTFFSLVSTKGAV